MIALILIYALAAVLWMLALMLATFTFCAMYAVCAGLWDMWRKREGRAI